MILSLNWLTNVTILAPVLVMTNVNNDLIECLALFFFNKIILQKAEKKSARHSIRSLFLFVRDGTGAKIVTLDNYLRLRIIFDFYCYTIDLSHKKLEY